MSSSPRRSALAVTALIAIIGAAFASSASAFPFEEGRVAISGNPLTVYVGQRGQLQGFLSGSSSGIYFAPQEQVGDAGFFLAFPTGGATPPSLQGTTWGFYGAAGPHSLEEYEPFFQGPVTGSGTAASPFSQVTEYEAEGVEVAQTTTYVNGSTEFKLKWEVFNETASPVNFRALTAADFYFEGDDRGTGVFTQGPPRFIGGTNVDSGRSGGFVEVLGGASPPWSHYQELPYPNVWTEKIDEAATLAPSVFNDTVDAEDVDNGGGVEWDQYESGSGLAPGKSATFELVARLATPAALQLNPTNAGSPQGVPVQITATALDSVGVPYAGRTLRYSITGANPGSGALTLDASGKAVITDPGTHAGGDTIAAFVDFNNNGIREPNEPQASALATFIDSIPASCKVSVKGDRPGGGGGAGNALVISVNCNEAATMTVQTTLIPPVSGAKKSSASASRAHKGKKKAKPIVLPKTKATVSAGVSTPVSIKVPKSVAKKYAGKTLTAKVVATVKDAAGNVSKAQTTSKVKIAPAKKAGKGKGHHGH